MYGAIRMPPVIRVNENLYEKLEKLAVGFDTPANVIERLVNFYNLKDIGKELPPLDKPTKLKAGRLYDNAKIQRLICYTATSLPSEELDQLCNLEYSKEQLGLNFPLLVRVNEKVSRSERAEAVKDSKGRNRWTWKHSFNRDGYDFAVSTQWYPKHDPLVRDWLKKHES